jgi:competence protein ComEA
MGGVVIVHVAGAVQAPGVYTLPSGARVIDGIRSAGGLAAGADASAINLARPLADGERVYIPRRGETPPAAHVSGDPSAAQGTSAAGGKVNLNTASAADLEALPGIGEVLAQRIVDYRTQHGPFRNVRDLLKVEGIGDKKFDSIKDYVTV